MSSRVQTLLSSTKLLRKVSEYYAFNSINSHSVFRRKMSSSSNIETILKSVFLRGVDVVRPAAIFNSKCFDVSLNDANQNIVIKVSSAKSGQEAASGTTEIICIDGSKRCHLVGFGKGVLGLAAEMVRVLGKRLQSGILSVPFGTVQQFSDVVLPASFKVFEGARNNLPDAEAEATARKVKCFVETLGADDVLFVLITGGGSALLPLPSAGVSLSDKCTIINQLASWGASISDINTVRIDLSDIKGGKLATAAGNAHRVVGLIVSDIVGNRIQFIASGPTIVARKPAVSEGSQATLERYGLWEPLAPHIQRTIIANSQRPLSLHSNNVNNFIIASNETAVNAAMDEARDHGLATVCISNKIDGLVSDLSGAYASLAIAILNYRCNKISRIDFQSELERLRDLLHFREGFLDAIDDILRNSHNFPNGICLIGGGEPTVRISGKGLGGRNQELALRFSIDCFRHEDILQDVVLFSAGTDGIDGMHDRHYETEEIERIGNVL